MMTTRTDKEDFIESFRSALTFQQRTRLEKAMRHPEKLLLFIASEVLRKMRISVPFRTKTFWGDPMAADLPTSQSLALYHLLESEVAMYFILGVNEGDTVFDIGAHYGFYTLLAARLAGSAGHVYAFEPTPRTFRVLEKNTKSFPNITLSTKAAWDTIGSVVLYDLGPLYSGGNTTKLDDTNRSIAEIKVETCTIDSYCSTNITPRFMKIDAEQAEREILRGAVKTIERCRPLVCLEMWNAPGKESYYQEIFSFFETRGYVAMVWINNALRPAAEGKSTVQNYLFVPKESPLVV